MPTFSFDDVLAPATVDEVRTKWYELLGAVDVDTSAWESGSPLRTFVEGSAIFISALSEVMSDVTRLGFLQYAVGDWLTLLAHHTYGVDRITESYATCLVTLTNASGSTYILGEGDLVVRNPTTNKTYRNDSAITLNPATTLTGVGVVAVEAGSESTSAIGTITQLVTSLSGVTVTNTTAAVGVDAETDASLRQACKDKISSLSPFGPADAYRYAATHASAGVTKTNITKDGYGNVTVYVAGTSGAVTAGNVALVQTAIEDNAQPLGVTATAVSATNFSVAVTWSVWMYNTSGYSEVSATNAINESISAYILNLPIGGTALAYGGTGYVFVDAIAGAIKKAIPEIYHCTVTLPAADQAMAASQVAVAGTFLGTVNLVAPPEGYTP